MPEGMVIDQRATMGSNVTQIAVQNNGMQPQEACQLAINLFMDNFPKLQQIAADTARERADEFCKTTIEKLQHANVRDYSAFSDPDVQYVLFDAQKNYARFGTKQMLGTLTDLVANRVTNNDDFVLKVTIDKAISVASMLTPQQLDFLSLLFLCTKVKHSHIQTLDQLETHLKRLCSIFAVNITQVNISYLNMLGCLQIELPEPVKILAQTYNLPREEVDRICPQQIKSIATDYGVSSVGTMLAITNAEQKTSFRFDPHIWIHE